jgi:hypothetical protein
MPKMVLRNNLARVTYESTGLTYLITLMGGSSRQVIGSNAGGVRFFLPFVVLICALYFPWSEDQSVAWTRRTNQIKEGIDERRSQLAHDLEAASSSERQKQVPIDRPRECQPKFRKVFASCRDLSISHCLSVTHLTKVYVSSGSTVLSKENGFPLISIEIISFHFNSISN